MPINRVSGAQGSVAWDLGSRGTCKRGACMLGIVLDRSLPTIIRIEASALPVSPGVMVLLAIGARCGREVTASSRHQALLPAKLLGDGRVTAFNVAGFGATPAAWLKVRAARRSAARSRASKRDLSGGTGPSGDFPPRTRSGRRAESLWLADPSEYRDSRHPLIDKRV